MMIPAACAGPRIAEKPAPLFAINESRVIRLWKNCLARTDLVTEDGEPVAVIYPGRAGDGRGADFRDAVIASARGLQTGDIELHVCTSDWRGARRPPGARFHPAFL